VISAIVRSLNASYGPTRKQLEPGCQAHRGRPPDQLIVIESHRDGSWASCQAGRAEHQVAQAPSAPV